MADFDPDSYLSQKPATGFDPDAYLNGESTASRIGTQLKRAATDIFPEIGNEASAGWDTLKNAKPSKIPVIGAALTPIETGKQVLGAARIAASPFVGTARSVLGHGMTAAEMAAGEYGIKPIVSALGGKPAPNPDPDKMYDTSKGDVDKAMMAMPASVAPRAPIPPPPLPDELGITLSQAEKTGDLALRQFEQGSARGEHGEPAQASAQQFLTQQRPEQVAEARNQITRSLDPNGGQTLASTPQETAQTVQQSLQRESARTKAQVDAAYQEAKDAGGELHTSTFEGMPGGIKNDLWNSPDRVIVDNNTPVASRMMDYLDREIGELNITNRAQPPSTGIAAPGPAPKAGVSLEGVEQWRKNLSRMRGEAYGAMGTNPSDARAADAVMRAFDDRIHSAVNDPGMFSGSPDAVAAWNRARDMAAQRFQTWGTKDPVGRQLQTIIGSPRQLRDPATLNKVADMLLGTSGTGATDANVGLARRVRDVLGEDSPEWATIRQGLFQRITAVPEGSPDYGPGALANRISKFFNGKGSDLAQTVFTPEQRDLITRFGELHRQMQVPQMGANWPNTARGIIPHVKEVGKRIFGAIGAMIGHHVMPFGGEIVGYGAGQAMGAATERYGSAQALKQVQQQMPIVGQRYRAWQQAVTDAQRTGGIQNAKSVTFAASNLIESLVRTGIDRTKAIQLLTEGPQGPGTGEAKERAKGGRIQTKPESKETLVAQQKQLLDGGRDAQLFPQGKGELKLPKGLYRAKMDNGDVFHYHPKRMNVKRLKAASKTNKENEVLGLGPHSKIEIMSKAKAGEHPVAVVERDPNGTEVRAAAGTHTTALRQLAHMLAHKSAGHTVQLERPDHTIARRASGGSVRILPSDYNTKLNDMDELSYRQWVKDNNVPTNPDATGQPDYDMRGFWQGQQQQNPKAMSAVDPNDGKLHYTDNWKTPSHETFSSASQWAQPNSPSWQGDQLYAPSGKLVYDDTANKDLDNPTADQLLSVPKAKGGRLRGYADGGSPATDPDLNADAPDATDLKHVYRNMGAEGDSQAKPDDLIAQANSRLGAQNNDSTTTDFDQRFVKPPKPEGLTGTALTNSYLDRDKPEEPGILSKVGNAAKRFTDYDREMTENVLGLPGKIYEHPNEAREAVKRIVGEKALEMPSESDVGLASVPLVGPALAGAKHGYDIATDPTRYQTWPERMVRSGGSLAKDVASGTVPTTIMDQTTGEFVPNPEVVERSQDMAGMAGGALATGATDATLGSAPFLRPALKYNGKIYKAPVGGQHLDAIPPEIYPEFQRQAMSGQDISNFNFGFMNHKGQFLDRSAAMDYAVNQGLIDPHAASQGALTSTILEDSATPGAALSALEQQHAPAFYSDLDKALSQAGRDRKLTGEQWINFLKNKGAKPEEMDWRGVNDLLNENKNAPVSKQQIQEHLDENKVELQPVSKGTMDTSKLPDEIKQKYASVFDENPGDHEAIVRGIKNKSENEKDNAQSEAYDKYLETVREPRARHEAALEAADSEYEQAVAPHREKWEKAEQESRNALQEKLQPWRDKVNKIETDAQNAFERTTRPAKLEYHKARSDANEEFRAARDAAEKELEDAVNNHGVNHNEAYEAYSKKLQTLIDKMNQAYEVARDKYYGILERGRAERDKVVNSVNDQFHNIRGPLQREHDEIANRARDEYDNATAPHEERQGKARDKADNEYYAIKRPAQQERGAAEKQAAVEHEKIEKLINGSRVKYPRYSIPGGTNYRERLLTLPLKSEAKVRDALYKKYGQDWEEKLQPDEKALLDKLVGKQSYTSSGHWEEPDVIAHRRTTDREIEGVPSLHTEEMQSDLHQQGRRQGYAGTDDSKYELKETGEQDRPWGTWDNVEKEWHRKYRNKEDASGDLEWQRKREDEYKIPNAPFKDSWHRVLIHDMLREAAENGHNRISWTSGESSPTNPRNMGHGDSESALKTEKGLMEHYNKKVLNYINKVGKEHKVEAKPTTFNGKAIDNIYEGPSKNLEELKSLWHKLNDQAGGTPEEAYYLNDVIHAMEDRDYSFPKAMERYGDGNSKLAEMLGGKFGKEFKKETGYYMDLPESLKKQILTKGFSLFSDAAEAGAPLAALEHPQQPAKPFYSAAEKAIQSASQQKMHGEQWANWLKNQNGVKPDELQYTGIDKWLREQKSPVTKQQVADYIDKNKVQVNDVEKGGKHFDEDAAREQAQEEAREWMEKHYPNADQHSDKWFDAHQDRAHEIYNKLEVEASDDKGNTKYSGWQLPGGENYREHLLTLPSVQVRQNAKGRFETVLPDGTVYQESNTLQNAQKIAKSISKKNQEYKSSHWDEPNILAHVRTNDRDVGGVPALHLEELQSDWHQKGRKFGYKGQDLLTASEKEEFKNLQSAGQAGPFTLEQAKRYRELSDKQKFDQTVPDAPFKTSWPELAMKRMIVKAAQEGKLRISWTPGEAQAARYDLSKQFNEISANPSIDHGQPSKTWWPKGKNGQSYDSIVTDLDGNIKQAGRIWGDIKGKNISEVIGKDIAEKGLKDGPQTLTGVDLKVGGEGMKGFYDQMLPKMVEKLGKKYGVKVKQGESPVQYSAVEASEGSDGGWNVNDANGEQVHHYANKQDADKFVKANTLPPVHYFDIPPKMKEDVLKNGFPLFSDTSQNAPLSALEKSNTPKHTEDELRGFIQNDKTNQLKLLRKEDVDSLRERSFKKPLSEDEISAIYGYAGEGENWNRDLRAGKKPSNDYDKFDQLQSVMSRSSLPQDVDLYRGLTPNGARAAQFVNNIKNMRIGEVFGDKGFFSTSVDENIARQFSSNYGAQKLTDLPGDQKLRDNSITMVIKAKKGEKAIPIDQEEGEVLLPTNTKLKLISKNDNRYVFERAPDGNPKFYSDASFGSQVNSNKDKQNVKRPEQEAKTKPEINVPQRASGGRAVASNINHRPSEAQQKAGNYKKDHISLHGLDITIENARNSIRRGVSADGTAWQSKLPAHYGYILTPRKDK